MTTNENSTGFIIEVNPVIGADDLASNLQAIINSNAPNGATIQFLNWTSPDIDAPLIRWARHRLTGDDLVKEMAQRRMGHLRAARYGTDHVVKAVPHHRRVFVACWLDGSADHFVLGPRVSHRFDQRHVITQESATRRRSGG